LKEINTIPATAHYTGATATCWKAESSGFNDYIVMNPNGESDVKRCSTAFPGQAVMSDSTITTVGGTPEDQTCLFDPGTGFSHCTTKPSELENKVTITCASLAADAAVTVTIGGPAAMAVTAVDLIHTVWEWTHW
jgi:hypothetical protein